MGKMTDRARNNYKRTNGTLKSKQYKKDKQNHGLYFIGADGKLYFFDGEGPSARLFETQKGVRDVD